MSGMLWLITEEDYELGVAKGLQHFEKTFGFKPDTIEINPAYEIKEVNGIKCIPNHKVQKSNAMYVSDKGLEALRTLRNL
jgi:hypothetical protein